mmetsp:Transcript_51193/g.81205  ORF Transcript_51193/g.81205 Transcript_51193/m.81205 type:complete len:216 (+) Transcript_51193:1355-2002(+)
MLPVQCLHLLERLITVEQEVQNTTRHLHGQSTRNLGRPVSTYLILLDVQRPPTLFVARGKTEKIFVQCSDRRPSPYHSLTARNVPLQQVFWSRYAPTRRVRRQEERPKHLKNHVTTWKFSKRLSARDHQCSIRALKKHRKEPMPRTETLPAVCALPFLPFTHLQPPSLPFTRLQHLMPQCVHTRRYNAREDQGALLRQHPQVGTLVEAIPYQADI